MNGKPASKALMADMDSIDLSQHTGNIEIEPIKTSINPQMYFCICMAFRVHSPPPPRLTRAEFLEIVLLYPRNFRNCKA